MATTINKKSASVPPKKSSHTRAKPPLVSLFEPGRLRVAHLLALFGVSSSTLYAGIKTGRYPEPDGKDGTLPYWNTSTIKRFLEA